MRIVFISFEAAPYAKVGGLADVAGALPAALARLGHEVSLVMPRFGHVDPGAHGLEPLEIPDDWSVGIDYVHHPFQAWRGERDGVEIVMLGNDRFFGREGIYVGDDGNSFGDELERIIFFSKGTVELMKCLDITPDIIHVNDYQTALVSAYVRSLYRDEPRFHSSAVIFSIHNLAYQGTYPAESVETMGFDAEVVRPMGPFEFNGTANLMKVGIEMSDKVTTVSPTYAREICSPAEGRGLEGLLQRHADKLTGVLNGIDTGVWNPGSDAHIAATYDSDDLEGKGRCKAALLEEMGLSSDRRDQPIIGSVGRLVEQKGLDLLLAVSDALVSQNATIIVLGSGAAEIEGGLRALRARHPGQVGLRIGFDEGLAHRITAGADMFAMPSRYEPCGLNQMYAMRYGTPPVVHRCGGLADTVVEWHANDRRGTGFLFDEESADGLASAFGRALGAYADPSQWDPLLRNGMRRNFGWDASARRYVEIYEEALDHRSRFVAP